MNTLALIPARYASNRLEGKPLVDLCGESLIERTYKQVKKARKIDQIFVITDDQRIAKHLQEKQIPFLISEKEHTTGTSRCYEGFEKLGKKADFIINVQGDEPSIDPMMIDFLVENLQQQKKITTLCYPLAIDQVDNPNIVKIVRNKENYALYFSRSKIPFYREKNIPQNYFGHVGIYGFPQTIFEQIQNLPISFLEQAEFLEQLNWLENGFSIYVREVAQNTQGIDTWEDVENFRKKFLDSIK